MHTQLTRASMTSKSYVLLATPVRFYYDVWVYLPKMSGPEIIVRISTLATGDITFKILFIKLEIRA